MVNLSAFFPRLIPYAPGAPEPLAQQALLDAAIEFCDRSLVVTQMLDPITLSVGTNSVELEAPTGLRVASVLRVWFDEQLLGPQPYAQAATLPSYNSTPTQYYGEFIDEIYSLTVVPAPDKLVRSGLKVRVALKPTRTATQVPDILFDHYAQSIVYGALGNLLAIPDQPFSNEAKSLDMTRLARAGAVAARVDALHGHLQSSMSVKMRAF